MAEKSLSYSTRVFVKNPGGAYDPAPLHEFDLHEMDHPPAFMPGDTLCSWFQLSGETKGRNHYYRVIERLLRIQANGFDVFILVEEVEPGWTSTFD